MECPFLIRMTLSISTDVWEVEIVLWVNKFILFCFFIGQHPVQKTQMGCSCIILPSTWERWHRFILRHPMCCCQISWLVPQSGKNAPGRKGGLGSFWEIYWPYVSLSFFNIYPFGSMDTFPVFPLKRFPRVFPWTQLNRFLSYLIDGNGYETCQTVLLYGVCWPGGAQSSIAFLACWSYGQINTSQTFVD